MKILVTGASGQLGYDLCRELSKREFAYCGLASGDMDITDLSAVRKKIQDYQPDAVLHCAAYTKVDLAEDEPKRCWAVNAVGTQNLALACGEIGAKLLYISTDYVFSGKGNDFYDPEDAVNPQNVYGMSKLAGELAVKALLKKYFIVRVSGVFGKNGNNFVKTMLKLSSQKKELTVVCDQIVSPTYTVDLARLLCDMIVTEKYGVYQATNEGLCSWSEFAEAIFQEVGADTKVVPVTTEEYNAKAVRPKNSRMSKEKLGQMGFSRLPDWRDALKRYLEEISEQA